MPIRFLLVLLVAFTLIVGCDSADPIDDDIDPEGGITTITDTTTVLVGQMRGTLLQGRTYRLRGDVIIPVGEEIVVQPGVTIIAEGDGSDIGPEFTIHGSFISLGTEQQPVFFKEYILWQGKFVIFKK